MAFKEPHYESERLLLREPLLAHFKQGCRRGTFVRLLNRIDSIKRQMLFHT